MRERVSYGNAIVNKGKKYITKGIYKLIIKDVEEVTKTAKGADTDYLKFTFDIADGEFKGYYANDYENQTNEKKWWKGTFSAFVPVDDGTERDKKTANRFKTLINAFEESNNGYHWDWNEKGLINKTIYGTFRNREYEPGKWTVECSMFVSAKEVEAKRVWSGWLEDKPLNGSSATSGNSASTSDFVNVASDTLAELPFN